MFKSMISPHSIIVIVGRYGMKPNFTISLRGKIQVNINRAKVRVVRTVMEQNAYVYKPWETYKQYITIYLLMSDLRNWRPRGSTNKNMSGEGREKANRL